MIESRTSSEGLISLNRLNHAVTHSLRSHFVLLKRIAVFCVWPFGMDRPNRLFCQTTRKLFTFAQWLKWKGGLFFFQAWSCYSSWRFPPSPQFWPSYLFTSRTDSHIRFRPARASSPFTSWHQYCVCETQFLTTKYTPVNYRSGETLISQKWTRILLPSWAMLNQNATLTKSRKCWWTSDAWRRVCWIERRTTTSRKNGEL